jgi:hypothetical protein
VQVIRRERTSVSFSRSFGLPANVRESDISASLDKGVLTVTLPKAQPAARPQPRRIIVQGAAASDGHRLAPAAAEEVHETGQAAAAAASAEQAQQE